MAKRVFEIRASYSPGWPKHRYTVWKKDSEEWWVGCRKSGEQKSKEKINENRETVMDSQYTWEDLETAADSRFPCHQMLRRRNLPRCDYISQRQKDFCCLLVWPCDTRTQMQKRRKYNLKVGAQELMPFGGKCDSASASELCEQDRTACRSVWNTIVPRQLQISNFYSTKIGVCCRPL